MTALILTLNAAPDCDLDLSPLVPERLLNLNAEKLSRLQLNCGGRNRRLGDLMDININPSAPDHCRIQNLTSSCHGVGAAMTGGTLHLKGAVGNNLGAGMTAGAIILQGSAGDLVGAGMRDGTITISGDAGNRVGGALIGQTKGMSGGVIAIRGSAGDETGERMRRGLIIVEENTGAVTGSRMIAGSIVVLGQCGEQVGAGMRRGSILLGEPPPQMLPSFNPSGEFELGFVPLMADYLTTLNPRYRHALAPFKRSFRWSGDLAYGGHGEILLPADRGR